MDMDSPVKPNPKPKFNPCLGCGYCCQKERCTVSSLLYIAHLGDDCPALQWNGLRYICKAIIEHPELGSMLSIGEGCSSPLNSWRQEVKERKGNSYAINRTG